MLHDAFFFIPESAMLIGLYIREVLIIGLLLCAYKTKLKFFTSELVEDLTFLRGF